VARVFVAGHLFAKALRDGCTIRSRNRPIAAVSAGAVWALMGEQVIGLLTGAILSISGLIMLALGSEPRRRDRRRRRFRVAGPMLLVSGLLVCAASLTLVSQDDGTPIEPLPTTESEFEDLQPSVQPER
jgi:hypothetical protein